MLWDEGVVGANPNSNNILVSSSDDDDEVEGEMFAAVVDDSGSRHSKSTRMRGCTELPSIKSQTGVKGVLNDYKQFQDDAEAWTQARDHDAYAKMHRIATTACGSESDDEFNDDAFTKDWLASRFHQMKVALDEVTFGTYSTVNVDGYLSAVENSPSSVFVVVHLYSTDIPLCLCLDRQLSNIATEYQRTRFLRLAACEASSVLSDPMALPALLVYRDGDLVGNFIRVSDEIGLSIDADSVKKFLSKHGYIA